MEIETNSINDFCNFINKSNFKKIFVLCGLNSYKKLSIKEYIKKFEKIYELKYFYKKQYLPTYIELIEITKVIKQFKPDAILAIGGGSVLDLAKISNCIELSDDLKEYIRNYSYPYKKKHAKLIALPTTAGSGAECTSNAVIYLDGIKYSFESEFLKPDLFFLIPELLKSSSFKINASAGFDALAQAMESLLAIKSNDESVSYSLKSIEILEKNFTTFLENPDLVLSSKMLIASHYAGKAINISKTTLPHAVSYPFSNIYGLGHGHAVSLFFEDFFEYNFNNLNHSNSKFDLRDRFSNLFKIFKCANIHEFKSKIKTIKSLAGLNDSLSQQKIIINQNLDDILKGINFLRLSNNPVKISKEKIIKIMNSK